MSIPPHALPSKAARALVMARSISSFVEFGIRAITSPVAGLRTSSIPPWPASTSRPSIKLPWISTSTVLGGIFMTLSFCLSMIPFGKPVSTFPGSCFDNHGIALQRRQHALLGGADMRLDDARRRAAVARLHRLDQRDVLSDELLRVVTPEVGDADAHQPVRLADQIAQRRR